MGPRNCVNFSFSELITSIGHLILYSQLLTKITQGRLLTNIEDIEECSHYKDQLLANSSYAYYIYAAVRGLSYSFFLPDMCTVVWQTLIHTPWNPNHHHTAITYQ